MKKITFQLSLLLCSLFLLNGCQKENVQTDETVTTEDLLSGNDYGQAQSLQTQTFLLVLGEAKKQPSLNGFSDLLQEKSLSCPTITVTPSGSTYPKTLIIDFGTGCTTSSGVFASGTITASVSGLIDKAATQIVITLTNFVYNGYQVNGTYNVTVVSAGVYSVSVQNGSVTKAGKTVTFSGSFNVTQVAGQSTTTNISDDIYDISVNLTGTDTSGKAFTVVSTTPLRKTGTCEWIISGIVEIKKGISPKAILDFGTGTCDNQATLKVGKATGIITLP